MAFATRTRSPKSCVSSLMYGVSPHPAHAPEYSNNGSRNCDVLWFDFRQIDARGVGQVEKECVVVRSASRSGACGCMSIALCRGVGAIFGRADIHAQVAAGAVLRRHLNRVGPRLELEPFVGHRLECGRCAGERAVFVHFGPDRRVRTHQHALIALNAERLVPHRDLERKIPLLPFRRAGRPRAVHRERAHRQQISLSGQEHGRDPLDELGCQRGHHRRTAMRRGHARRYRHLMQMGQCRVDSLEIALHDFGAALAVGLFDRVLDLRDGLCARQDAGDREEAGLHDRVDPAAHAVWRATADASIV